jgi:periplasmic protein TonB
MAGQEDAIMNGWRNAAAAAMVCGLAACGHDPVAAPPARPAPVVASAPATITTTTTVPPESQWVPAGGKPARMDANDARCRPEYPPAAMRVMAQGTVALLFEVDAGGKVVRVLVLRSAGPLPEHQLMDRAAAQALARCPIKPGTDAQGQPARTYIKVEYVWMLR